MCENPYPNLSGIALVSAIRSGQLKDYKTVSEALVAGLFQNRKASLGSSARGNPDADDGMSLSEALIKGLVDIKSGKVTDRYSGKTVKLSDAIKRGLINPNTLEIFDQDKSMKISLKEALEKGIINEVTGQYGLADKISFSEAAEKKFVMAPMTIKECADTELLSDKGIIKCPTTGVNMSILDAIGKGVLDVDLKSVKDVKEGQLVSLAQALAQNIIVTNDNTITHSNGKDFDEVEWAKEILQQSKCFNWVLPIHFSSSLAGSRKASIIFLQQFHGISR